LASSFRPITAQSDFLANGVVFGGKVNVRKKTEGGSISVSDDACKVLDLPRPRPRPLPARIAVSLVLAVLLIEEF